MNYEGLILHMLSKLQKERTINSVYHILRGKRSTQTIQDIHLFNLEKYYKIYPNLNQHTYKQWINNFMNNDFLILKDNSFEMTEEGQTYIHANFIENDYKFNGVKFNRIDQLFFQTLQLLCQTVSHLIYNRNQFIPVIENLDAQNKVKSIIKKYNNNRVQLYEGIYHELYRLFGKLVGPVDWLALQLTSAKQIGLSKKQIAELYNVSVHDVYLTTTHLIHQMIDLITNEKNYTILRHLVEMPKQISVTDSAMKTYDCLKRGLSIKEISHYRHLKISTIEDHIVELATQISNFPIQSFVSEATEDLIKNKVEQAKTKRLKIIKEMLPEHITYFQIRLVLSKFNRGSRKSESVN
ncbi:helix-turn-helix domain-containing protein [Bacillaceae bacterium W0354]